MDIKYNPGTSQVISAAGALACAFAAGSSFAATDYSETWSAGDTNGWISNTTSTVVVRDAAVGNPAGSLASRRDLSADPSFAIIGATTELAAASGSYLGSPAWTISFDVLYDLGAFTDALLRFRYQDGTFNGWVFDVENAFGAGWHHYSVSFQSNWTDVQATANGWVQEAASVPWQTLMSDVFHPEVRLLLGNDSAALAHIDNFTIQAIPESSEYAMLLAGLGLVGLAAHRRKQKKVA